MQKSKQITDLGGSVGSAGMLSRNRICGSFLLYWCSGWEHTTVKSVLLCYRGVEHTGQQATPLTSHLPNTEGSCQPF